MQFVYILVRCNSRLRPHIGSAIVPYFGHLGRSLVHFRSIVTGHSISSQFALGIGSRATGRLAQCGRSVLLFAALTVCPFVGSFRAARSMTNGLVTT